MKLPRIYGYLGATDPVLEARRKTRCGQSTTGQDPVEVGEIPEDISDPFVVITPPVGGRVLEVDCESLTPSTFVAVAVVRDASGNERLIAAHVTVDPIDSVSTTVVTDQLIDESFLDWFGGLVSTRNISVCKLSSDKFVVYAIRSTSTNHTLYSIVCTVSGTTITAQAPVEMTDFPLNGTVCAVASIRPAYTDDVSIVCYTDRDEITSTFPAVSARVVTFSGTAIDTVGSKLIVHASGNPVDIDQVYSATDDSEFVITGRRLTPSVAVVLAKVTRSGTTLTKTATSDSLGINTGTHQAQVSNLVSYDIVMGDQGVSGSELKVLNHSSLAVIDSEDTADNGAHAANRVDVESVGGQGGNPDRVFALYGSGTDGGDGGLVAMEVFTAASGVLTPLKTHNIDTFRAHSMRISQFGFTATKAPFVYVSRVVPLLDANAVAKAVVYEAGTG